MYPEGRVLRELRLFFFFVFFFNKRWSKHANSCRLPKQAIRSQMWWVWGDKALSDILISGQTGRSECSHCINVAGSALFIFRFSQSHFLSRGNKAFSVVSGVRVKAYLFQAGQYSLPWLAYPWVPTACMLPLQTVPKKQEHVNSLRPGITICLGRGGVEASSDTNGLFI